MFYQVTHKIKSIATIACSVFCAAWASSSMASQRLLPIAVTGQALPGADNAVFVNAGQTRISSSGVISFSSTRTLNEPPYFDYSHWHQLQYRNGSVEVVARAGELWDGKRVDSANLLFTKDDRASVYRINQRVDAATNQYGVGAVVDGRKLIYGWNGDAAPGLADGFRFTGFAGLSELAGSEAGVVFRADAVNSPSQSKQGVWMASDQGVRLVAGTGATVLQSGGKLYTNFYNPSLNAHGDVAFAASTTGGAGNETVVMVSRNGVLTPVVQAGLLGFYVVGGTRLGFNNRGDVTFRTAHGPSVDPQYPQRGTGMSFWLSSSNGLIRLATESEPAVGLGPEIVWSGLSGDAPIVNSQGRVAFIASVRGPGVDSSNNTGIWANPRGSLELVARTGDIAPGTGGMVFSAVTGRSLYLNSAGYVVFTGEVRPSSGDDIRYLGVWARSPEGDLQLVVRTGVEIDISSDPANPDRRMISELFFFGRSGMEDGYSKQFNDSGQLVLMLRFTDGTSGVFTTTIPAPGMLGLGAAGLISFGRRRRAA